MSATQDYIACENCKHHESRSVFSLSPFCTLHIKDNPKPCSQFTPSSMFLRCNGNTLLRLLRGLEEQKAALQDRIDALEWLREVEEYRQHCRERQPKKKERGELVNIWFAALQAVEAPHA